MVHGFQHGQSPSAARGALARRNRRGRGGTWAATLLAGVALLLTAGPALARSTAATAHKSSTAATAHKSSTRATAHKSSVVPRGMTLGIGDTPQCISAGSNPVPTLKRYGVRAFHEVLPPYANPAVAARCLAAAAAAGYRVSVAIQYNNWWNVAADVAWFKQALPAIAPYVSEVSIGNEQELWTGGVPQKPSMYAKVWRAVEPIVRRDAPRTLIGAGEISPWGEPFLKAAWRLGLPGAQVITAHPYRKPGAFSISELLQWAHGLRRPVWFTEGVLMARAWGVSLPAADLAGASYAFAWLR